jgi:hypothetical protein
MLHLQNLGWIVRPEKRGRFVTKVAGTQSPGDASSMGRNVLWTLHPGDASSIFFEGRKIRGHKVQGRNVMVPRNSLNILGQCRVAELKLS